MYITPRTSRPRSCRSSSKWSCAGRRRRKAEDSSLCVFWYVDVCGVCENVHTPSPSLPTTDTDIYMHMYCLCALLIELCLLRQLLHQTRRRRLGQAPVRVKEGQLR